MERGNGGSEEGENLMMGGKSRSRKEGRAYLRADPQGRGRETEFRVGEEGGGGEVEGEEDDVPEEILRVWKERGLV